MTKLPDAFAALSPQKLALAAQKQALNRAVVNAEPIAIIGMGCRFPGGADNPERFWQLLHDGVDTVTEVPKSRWDADAFYHPDPDAPGKIYTRYGNFLSQVDKFDPAFFGISPREARMMDPQQRLLLEVSWESLEHAGIDPACLRGSQTGVFIGMMAHDYAYLSANELAQIDAYTVTGSMISIAAGRLAYFLGTHGPTFTVDTTCSASLVSVHLACQSLRMGECNMALAGGVQLMLSPHLTIMEARLHMFSADGRCKAFDAAADGMGRGEGCGMIVLKRLSDAIADGDNILALIRSSSVNHDGRSSGLTVPNGPAQEQVIQQALDSGGVSPKQVSYVETHGTGTPVGDLIEVGTLEAVYGSKREAPLIIGSVKTNIGHTEGAAGIAGLLKVVLSLQHEEIPPHLHFHQPNPHIPWQAYHIEVPNKLRRWPEGDRRIAGVSSFGLSGTNAHIILEATPQGLLATPAPTGLDLPAHLLTLSAKTEAALRTLAEQYADLLVGSTNLPLGDLCFTTHTGRSHFDHRLSIVGGSSTELQEKLAVFIQGTLPAGAATRQTIETGKNIAFLFTGQGSQYVGMGRELYETQATFRAAIDRCDALLYPLLGESILAVLYPDKETERGVIPQIDDTTYTQPALFALEYALATLWQSWGIQPEILLGHSVGEVVAACVAGVFSLEDGLKLIAARGRLMGALPQDGEMLSVMSDEAHVQKVIAPYPNEVSIAALNGPQSVVISGKRETVKAIGEQFAAEGIKCRKLTVSHAFHSPLMQPMLAEFRQVATSITYHKPKLRLVSNLTGKLTGDEITTPDYWVRHVRQAVRFADGVQTLHQQGIGIFLEIGPKPVLLGMAEQGASNKGQVIEDNLQPATCNLPSLREGQSDWQQMLTSLGELYVKGVKIDWFGFDKEYQRRKVVLPTYPFQRQRYWIESNSDQDKSRTTQNGFAHWLNSQNLAQLAQLISDKGHFNSKEQETVAKVLTMLESESRTQQLTEQVEAMLYEVSWQQQDKPLTVQSPAAPGHWLILADQNGLGQAVAQRLQADGHQTTLFYPPEIASSKTTETWDEIIYAKLRDAFIDFFSQAALTNSTEQFPLRGVLHLWSLDTVSLIEEKCDLDDVMKDQALTCGSLLALIQALEEVMAHSTQRTNRAKLWVITSGGQVLPTLQTQTSIAPLQASLWGLGRVASLEHPDLWGGLIDLDPSTFPTKADFAEQSQPAENDLKDTVTALWQEFFSSDNEEQIAYRHGQRYVARLVHTQPNPRPTPVTIQPDGSYLITGGLGGLGQQNARWLVEQGAKKLILTNRRGITEPAQKMFVEALTEMGVTVKIAQVDVADKEAMHDLFSEILTSPSLLPLRGIIHAAGLAGFQPIRTMTWADFVTVLRPKILGTFVLHHLVRHLNLDFFIFYASGAGIWGGKGQAHYGAANHFLDNFAAYRRLQQMPGLSIAWGPWSGKGMASEESLSQLRASGVYAFTPKHALALQSYLLQSEAYQATVADIDWSQLRALYEMTRPRPFFAELKTEASTKESTTQKSTEIENVVLQQLKAQPSNRQLEYLWDYLQQTVAHILAMTDKPDRSIGFTALGMDSLMAMQLHRHLEQGLSCTLPATIAFEYPTVESLANYLLTKVLILPESKHIEPNDVDTNTSATPVQRRPHHDHPNEPIAVVSMACRFPGADTPEAFWQLLQNGVDAVQEIPASRWKVEEYYNPQRPLPGKMYMREAAFVEGIDSFDPLFFGIAPREAMGMDPMHRLLLEVSWEALERAGLAQATLVDSATGVFVGIGASEYGALNPNQDLAELHSHSATGSGHSIAAGRLAFTLGLQGPTMAVDTACSSSLVSLHLACQSLRAGECDLALAGGVSLMLSPIGHVALSQMQALSPDGRCKTFDASADGYGRGEGGGMVVLKRLGDAKAAGDEILAVIQGSAVNHDGPSSGLTVPNKRAQEKLLRQALTNAQVTADEVAYIEAHGTGTPLGDPIELRAIGAVFGNERQQPMLVGSVKTNIGHLEAAAGIASFVKTVLALQHGQIPAHLHFQQPNPYIEWDEFAIEIPTSLQPWPQQTESQRRVAGISSFGISGTNAHLIVAAAEAREGEETRASKGDVNRTAQEPSHHLLTLSAKSERALVELVQRYQHTLHTEPTLAIENICYTAVSGRNHFAHRLALVAENATNLQTKLAAIQQGEQAPTILRGHLDQTPSRIAFLFTGQGAQYVNMGRELYETQSTFRAAIDCCDALLHPLLGESILAVLYPDKETERGVIPQIDDTAYTQPALFVLEYALATLWQSWGIEPEILIGHSVGEVVAACVAGVFSLEDGLKLIAARGRLMGALPQDGEMLSVMSDEAHVQQGIAPYPNEVSIAALNGPESVVISGKRETVLKIAEQLAAEGIKTHKLTVSHAFHSPLMQPMLVEFRQVAASITYHKPKLPMVSNLTGKLAGDEISTPDYWVRHVREAVRFADGVQTLHQQGVGIFLEIGPKPVLLGMAEQGASSKGQVLEVNLQPATCNLPSLREGQSDWQQMLTSLGELYVRGVRIDWVGFDRDYQRRKIVLPTYPFQRQRYWLDSAKQRQAVTGLRPLIDKKTYLPHSKQTVFEKAFSTDTLPFLADHHVYGEVVVPGACHLALALSAADLLFDGDSSYVQDVIFPQALVLLPGEERMVQLVIEAPTQLNNAVASSFQIISFSETETEAEPLLHATGQLARSMATAPTRSLSDLRQRCAISIPPATLYKRLAESQVELGPTFRWFADIWRGTDHEAIGRMMLPAALTSVQGYPLFPSLIDASLQLIGATEFPDEQKGVLKDVTGTTRLPFALESLTLYRPIDHQNLWCHVKQVDENRWQITLLNESGEVCAAISGFQMRALPAAAIQGHRLQSDWLYTLDWEPYPLLQNTEVSQRPSCWLLFGAEEGTSPSVSQALSQRLAMDDTPIVLVTPAHQYTRTASTQTNTIQRATLDPANPEMFRRLLSELAIQYPSVGIGYLWGAEEIFAEVDIPTRSLQLCSGLLHLVQALSAQPLPQQPLTTQLWVVTAGCHNIAEEQTDRVSSPAAGALWGLGRTVAQEHPQLHTVCIDLEDVSHNESQLAQMAQEMVNGWKWEPSITEHASEIAYRQEKRYVARLRSWQPDKQSSTQSGKSSNRQQVDVRVNPSASYLITGGLGSLGLEIAEQLVADGARHLILTSRRNQVSESVQSKIIQMEQVGAMIAVIPADIANEEAVQVLLAHCETIAPLRGIVHAAGLLDDGVLTQQTMARFEQVMRPKVDGTWYLHTHTLNKSLDFFVCFSSVASLFGAAGQSNYAAANAFMDTLMQQRQRQGLSGLSINWGAWADIGMAAQEETRQRLHKIEGMRPMSPQSARKLFAYLLNQAVTQTAILSMNPARLVEDNPALSMLLSPLLTERAENRFVTSRTSNLYEQLEPLSAKARYEFLARAILTDVAQTLGIAAPEQISLQQPLFELGIDSLMALELKNKLERKLNSALHSTLLFDYPIINHLTTYLLDTIFPTTEHDSELTAKEATTNLAVTDQSAEFIAQKIDQLSGSELLDLINQFGTNW